MSGHGVTPPTTIGAVDDIPGIARGLTFGSAAELYERYRPGYPAELVSAVQHHLGRPIRSALEVGAGTGKATRLFASRNIEVTALEPDPDMARVLRRTTRALPVRVVENTFELFRSDNRFDLVFAAAAWHWTDPATRWARAVNFLVPGGVLALFGRPDEPKDAQVSTSIEQIESRLLSDDDPTVLFSWTLDEIDAAPGLARAVGRDLPGTQTTSADDFVGRLATVSAYLKLSASARADALSQVRAALPDQFDLDATTELTLARRLPT